VIRRVQETPRLSVVAGAFLVALLVAVLVGRQTGVLARSDDTSSRALVHAIEAAQASEDLSGLAEAGISISVRDVGLRRLITVAIQADGRHCLVARSSEPQFVEFAGALTADCSANVGADPALEWTLQSDFRWADES
jgi:hypothetical protein